VCYGIQSILLGSGISSSTNGFMNSFQNLEYVNLDAVTINGIGAQSFVYCAHLGFYPKILENFKNTSTIGKGSFDSTL
jgi:hypothetical protein